MAYRPETPPINTFLIWNDKKGKWQSFEAIWFDEYGSQEFVGYGRSAEEAKAELLELLQRKCAEIEVIMRTVREAPTVEINPA